MADKNKQHPFSWLSRLQIWQLVIIFLLLVFVSATFLRLNNVGMVQRRDAVIQADERGDDNTTRERLYDLQRFSSAHMNADTGIIYLQGSFDREWARQYSVASKKNSQHLKNIYKKVEDEVCGPEAKLNGWRWPNPQYIACQRRELAKYPGSNELVNQLDPPKRELFRHSFVSPRWSPDYAGFAVLATVIIGLVIIARITGVIAIKAVLYWRHKSQ